MFNNRKLKYLFFTGFLFCFVAGAVLAADWYISAPGSTVTVDEHSDCQKVINNSGSSYFIPTKTNSEWQAFQNNLPTNVSLDSCCVSHANSSCVGGDVYWFDSCGNQEEEKENCGGCGCSGSSCTACCTPHYVCHEPSDTLYYVDCVNPSTVVPCPCGCGGIWGDACVPTRYENQGINGCTTGWLQGCGGPMENNCVYGTVFFCGAGSMDPTDGSGSCWTNPYENNRYQYSCVCW